MRGKERADEDRRKERGEERGEDTCTVLKESFSQITQWVNYYNCNTSCRRAKEL